MVFHIHYIRAWALKAKYERIECSISRKEYSKRVKFHFVNKLLTISVTRNDYFCVGINTMARIRLNLLLAIAILSAVAANAQDSISPLAEAPAIAIAENGDTATVGKRPSIFQRFINYFAESNKTDKNKRFDISFIGGPSYTNSTSFAVGVMGSGLYRMNGCDASMQPSNVTVYTTASVVGSINTVLIVVLSSMLSTEALAPLRLLATKAPSTQRGAN